MSGMVGGFRRVVGVEKRGSQKKRGVLDIVLTLLLLGAIIALLFYRFG